jgi:hypothetical protein
MNDKIEPRTVKVKAHHLIQETLGSRIDPKSIELTLHPRLVILWSDYDSSEYPEFRTVVTLASNRESYIIDLDNASFDESLGLHKSSSR